MTIDGGGIRIQTRRQTPLNTLEAPVIVLGGSEDCPQRIPQRIEGNDVGVGDSRHV
jgi:hypothetical protein